MHRTVSVVVIANRAIELVVAQDAVERLAPRVARGRDGGRHFHAGRHRRGAGAHQFSVDLYDAGIARLNRPQLRVIADLRQLQVDAIDCVDQPAAGFRLIFDPVDGNWNHVVSGSFDSTSAWLAWLTYPKMANHRLSARKLSCGCRPNLAPGACSSSVCRLAGSWPPSLFRIPVRHVEWCRLPGPLDASTLQHPAAGRSICAAALSCEIFG